jgi:two-component system, chemotaxis family, response regulator Rcp1
VEPLNGPRTLDILLVEDNLAEAHLMEEAMNQGRVHSHVHHVRDGAAALAFLHHKPPYANAPTPDVILLDLNMPGKGGKEVLSEIKADPWLRLLPVVMLTTSQADQDILHTYKLGVNCFIIKPEDLDKFMDLIRVIEEFFSIVKSPKEWPIRREEMRLTTRAAKPAAPATPSGRIGRPLLWSS